MTAEEVAKQEAHARRLQGAYNQARETAVAFKMEWIEAQEAADIAMRKWVEAQVEVGKVQLASWLEEKKETYKE